MVLLGWVFCTLGVAGGVCVDTDGDGVGDDCDFCVTEPDPAQLDSDLDEFPDACDNCPAAFNPGQTDSNGDLEGDACDLNDNSIYFSALDATLVTWQREAGFSQWNLYKGDLDVLRLTGGYTQLPGSNPIAERICNLGLSSNFWFDSAPIDAGAAAFYLVSGTNALGEGSLGVDSSGVLRPNTNPCP